MSLWGIDIVSGIPKAASEYLEDSRRTSSAPEKWRWGLGYLTRAELRRI